MAVNSRRFLQTAWVVVAWILFGVSELGADEPNAHQILEQEIQEALADEPELAEVRGAMELMGTPHSEVYGVTTTEGLPAEVILMSRTLLSVPGQDACMAILLVDGKYVDSVFCRANTRQTRCIPHCEDLNGDGFLDVGILSQVPAPEHHTTHRFRGDKKHWWFAAYTITSSGFKSIFPDEARFRRVHSSINPTPHPIKVTVEGVPLYLRDLQPCRIKVTATNTSAEDFIVNSGEWLAFSGAASARSLRLDPIRLRSGESCSQYMSFFSDHQDRVEIECGFVQPRQVRTK